MKEKIIQKNFWERLTEVSLFKLLLGVFLFALSERLVVMLVFFLRWGFHAVSGIELWFYYGVARGSFELYSNFDPTWWILKTLGLLFSGPVLLYSVYLTSSIASSLNAALFALFVSKLHDRKTGLLAGILYGSMVLPMFNSAGTVTHDIFAYPYLILSLFGIMMVFRRQGPIRLAYLGFTLAVLFLGLNVGPTILVGFGTIVIYLIWQAVRGVTGSRKDGYVTFGVFLLAALGLVLLLHYQFMPDLMEKMFDLAEKTRGIDVRAQIKAGSGDLLASSLGDYWLRFNFLIFFLPVGIWVAIKKKDMLGLLLLMAAILASRAADRGTRPLTFPLALLGALAFVNWKSSYNWILALFMGFIIGQFGGKYSTEYAIFFPVAGILIYLMLQWPRRGEKAGGDWTVFIITLLWLAAGGILGGINHRAMQAGNRPLVEELRKYWTVQLCLLLPLALLLLREILRKLAPEKGKKQSRSADKPPARFLAPVLTILLGWAVLMTFFRYIGLEEDGSAGILSPVVKFSFRYLYLFYAPAAAGLIFYLGWPDRNREKRSFLAVIPAVCWIFATVIPSMNQTPKSTEGEYRIYHWLSEHTLPGKKIFVPWSDGYMAGAVSNLKSELTPENIDFRLPRVYWLPEDQSARFLRRQGIEYLMISTKYFRLLGYNRKTGEFRYSFSPDIIYRPDKIGITNVRQLEKTTLFKLLYRPKKLTEFRLLHLERDPAGKAAYLAYQVLPEKIKSGPAR